MHEPTRRSPAASAKSPGIEIPRGDPRVGTVWMTEINDVTDRDLIWTQGGQHKRTHKRITEHTKTKQEILELDREGLVSVRIEIIEKSKQTRDIEGGGAATTTRDAAVGKRYVVSAHGDNLDIIRDGGAKVGDPAERKSVADSAFHFAGPAMLADVPRRRIAVGERFQSADGSVKQELRSFSETAAVFGAVVDLVQGPRRVHTVSTLTVRTSDGWPVEEHDVMDIAWDRPELVDGADATGSIHSVIDKTTTYGR